MARSSLVLIAVTACGRIGFDLEAAPGPDGALRDALPGDVSVPADGTSSPVVQAVGFDTASGNFVVDATHGGLLPVTAGNMVLLVCGAPSTTGTCNPTSTPAATWTRIDPGTTLSVYVVCGAPAITSIQLQDGAGNMMAAVVEFAGVVGTSCYDTGNYGAPCAPAPSTWSITSAMLTQAHELIVALGEAGGVNAGWTTQAPYTTAIDAKGVNGAEDVFVAYQVVDQPPAKYTASGTIASWNLTCYNDIFGFIEP